MADSSALLKQINTRNQVLLERLKQGEHEKFAPFLKEIEKQVRIRISQEGSTIISKKRLNTLLADVSLLQKAVYEDYLNQFTLDLGDTGVSQSVMEAGSYSKAVKGFESTVPSPEQVIIAVKVNPLQVADYTGNPLLGPFMKDWSTKETQRVRTAIQQGFYQGQTNAQITQGLRGTKANNYNDGEYAKVNRSNRTMVRTAVQHSSTQARHETMSANKDLIVGYEWVSTLDSKTSDQCTALDGREFKIGEGPLPPIHPGCRSTTTPVLDEKYDFLKQGRTRASNGADGGKQVSTKQTYYTWLKDQPVAFQNEAIGIKRSKLLRDGGLTSEEFSRLSLNRNFEAMTLAQMEAANPAVFEAAGF